MLQKILKIVPLTTLFLTYIFVCGCLYLIGYWSTFQIDVTSFISLTDISKSFVYPLILSQVLGLCFFLILSFFENKNQGESNYEWMKRTNVKVHNRFRSIVNILILVGFLFAVRLYKNHQHSDRYWNIFCLLFTILFSLKFLDLSWLNKITKSTALTFYISFAFLYIPFASLQTGKTNSLKVYNNKSFTHIKLKTDKILLADTIDYKLLGLFGSRTLISTLDNSKTIIMNQNSYDAIEIEKK